MTAPSPTLATRAAFTSETATFGVALIKPFAEHFRTLQNLTGRVPYAFNTCQGMSGSSLEHAPHSSPIVAAAVVVWLIVKASEDLRQFAVVTLNGITLAALFFVVASGFTLIFGLMRVVNMAHGSLYLLGGYLALEMQDSWFKEDTGLGLSLSGSGDTTYDLVSWVVPLILATLIIGIVGVILQQVFLRWNQGQDLRQALITIALSVIFADQMLAAFGGISKDIKTPTDWPRASTCPATCASASSAASSCSGPRS